MEVYGTMKAHANTPNYLLGFYPANQAKIHCQLVDEDSLGGDFSGLVSEHLAQCPAPDDTGRAIHLAQCPPPDDAGRAIHLAQCPPPA